MMKECVGCEYKELVTINGLCDMCRNPEVPTYFPRKKQNKSITFHELNGLTPTVESCTLKVLEEVGELMQLIGKGQGLSGEVKSGDELSLASDMMSEAFDVAQSAVTMIYTLSDKYNMPIDGYNYVHEHKLIERGYLK